MHMCTDQLLDNETDGIIQTSLRRELGKDVTLLTVAHRLRTVMDADKIVSHSSTFSSGIFTDRLHSWSSMLDLW